MIRYRRNKGTNIARNIRVSRGIGVAPKGPKSVNHLAQVHFSEIALNAAEYHKKPMPVPQIVTKERVESLADEVLLAWRIWKNGGQARQEVSPGILMSFLPGLPVIQISRHSPSEQNFISQTFNPLHSSPHILSDDLGHWHRFLVIFCSI